MRNFFSMAALVSLLFTGCSLDTGPAQLTVDVATSLARFKAGDAVDVTVTVTNNSDETVSFAVTSCPSHFAVRDAAGTIVGPATEICTAQAIVKSMAPGEIAKFKSTWHGEALAGAFLKPGIYKIEGFFGIGGDSNPATVEITL